MISYVISLRGILLRFITAFLLLTTGFMMAHSMGESYVFMNINENSVKGRFELTCDDLNKALQLNDSTGLITADNYGDFLTQIQEYVVGH
ncbi:MAG: hypothetical protein AAFP70_02255, partial [Calditrichota bacterium]